ncbi:MAG: two-component regulator propeller domain-containing protein [Phycisphaerae bacterium]
MRPIFASPAAALLIGLSVLLPALSIHAGADAATVKGAVSKSVKHAVKSAEIPLNCPARFITAMVPDGNGDVWVAGEDTGIYHGALKITPSHSNHKTAIVDRASNPRIRATWTEFNKSNSPGLIGNSIYSLCIDHRGRLWAGTNRHGVCVYNGHKWRHFGLITGPLGSHVVAISSDPRDGSVWMCTENGLSIYMPHGCGTKSLASGIPHAATLAATPLVFGRWRYISRLNGLPANPDCVAFNKQGTAFVGTLCGGLAVAAYPYIHWRVIHGPWHLPISAPAWLRRNQKEEM